MTAKQKDFLSVGFAKDYERVKALNPYAKLNSLANEHAKAAKLERAAWERYMKQSNILDDEYLKWKVKLDALQEKAITNHDNFAMMTIMD